MNSLVMNYNINFPISIPISTELQLPKVLSKIREREKRGGGWEVKVTYKYVIVRTKKKEHRKKNKPKGDIRKHEM